MSHASHRVTRRPHGCFPPGRRRGATLLEALVALAILATAVVATAAMAADAAGAAARARDRDAALRRASALMDAVALWPREDLDRHLGERAEGPWVLRIDRPAPTLYNVTLLAGGDDSTAAPGAPLLATSLYRPSTAGGAR